MPTTTKPHRRQKPRTSHEIINYRPPHRQHAQHDLHCHKSPQQKLSMGKSRSPPSVTDASCIKQSHVQVSALSRMREQRIKEMEKSSGGKLYYWDLSKENKGPLQMSDGSNLCLFSILREIPMAQCKAVAKWDQLETDAFNFRLSDGLTLW